MGLSQLLGYNMQINKENLQQIADSVWCKVYEEKGYVAAYYGSEHVYIYNEELEQISKVDLDKKVELAEIMSEAAYESMEGLPNEDIKEVADGEISRIRGLGNAGLDDF